MSHDSLNRALSALRDVAGVHGSFVLQPTGELLGKDLPAVFHDDLFIEVTEDEFAVFAVEVKVAGGLGNGCGEGGVEGLDATQRCASQMAGSS